MDTPLVIDSEDAARLARELSALTGQSLAASVVAALTERLQRERAADARLAARAVARAAAANMAQEGRHLACVPTYGWCTVPGGARR